jgi:hypothetical protein
MSSLSVCLDALVDEFERFASLARWELYRHPLVPQAPHTTHVVDLTADEK